MDLLEVLGISVIFIIVAIWLLNSVINNIFNIFFHSGEHHEGMIWNPKDKKIEADNSEIDVL